MKTFKQFFWEKSEVKPKPKKKNKSDEEEKPVGSDKVSDVIDVKPKLNVKPLVQNQY